eukprot:5949657-Pyramimonas_sp.AAC.1
MTDAVYAREVREQRRAEANSIQLTFTPHARVKQLLRGHCRLKSDAFMTECVSAAPLCAYTGL